MSRIITSHMLLQKIQEVNRQAESIPRQVVVNGQSQPVGDTTEPLVYEVKNITRVRGDTMICDDGTEGVLFNPLPCVFWKCLTVCNGDGVAILENPIRGLFLGNKSGGYYCLGVQGDTSEFELRLVIGGSEIRLNDTFLNISAEHIVKNGLEE